MSRLPPAVSSSSHLGLFASCWLRLVWSQWKGCVVIWRIFIIGWIKSSRFDYYLANGENFVTFYIPLQWLVHKSCCCGAVGDCHGAGSARFGHTGRPGLAGACFSPRQGWARWGVVRGAFGAAGVRFGETRGPGFGKSRMSPRQGGARWGDARGTGRPGEADRALEWAGQHTTSSVNKCLHCWAEPDTSGEFLPTQLMISISIGSANQVAGHFLGRWLSCVRDPTSQAS